MRKNPYFINILLSVVVGIGCLAGVLMRTFSPWIILPILDIPFVVMLCVIPCVIEYYLNGESRRERILSAVIAGLTFSLLPLCAGFTFGVPVWKLFLLGTAVFFVTDLCYGSIAKRMSSGVCGVFSPLANGMMLYLASQCLQGLL